MMKLITIEHHVEFYDHTYRRVIYTMSHPVTQTLGEGPHWFVLDEDLNWKKIRNELTIKVLNLNYECAKTLDFKDLAGQEGE